MADAVAITPGKDTSEYGMAKFGQYAGLAMVIGGSVFGFLSDLSQKFPNAHWLAVALIVVGGILKLGSFLGYNTGRTELKIATLADAQKELSK